MPRRPDLIKASLWAGLLCLSVSLTGPERVQGASPAPVPGPDLPKVGLQDLRPPLLLVARPATPANQGASPRAATLTSRRGLPGSYHYWVGGILAPRLCRYVFGYPVRSFGEEGLWPPGLLDILLAAACGFLGYRLVKRRRRGEVGEATTARRGFLRQEDRTPPPLQVAREAESGLAAISAENPGFDPQAFGEEIRGLLLEVYAAWNRHDLDALNGRVKEGLLEYLRMGLKIMSFREENSYLEDLSLEGIVITAAGVNDSKEFITVCFKGWLLDYVLDKQSGKLLVGSMAYPTSFQEFWDLERPRGQDTWVLQDIRES